MTDRRYIWVIEHLYCGAWTWWGCADTKREALAVVRACRKVGGKYRVVKYVPEVRNAD